MRRIVRRSLATAAVLALTTGAAACSTEDAAEEDSTVDAATTETFDDTDVAVDSIVGLEVTAVGNVSDVLSDEAIRLDRDGLGDDEDQGEVGDRVDYDYDYDYYEYDYLTEFDEDFEDDDLADEGVLVLGAAGLEDRTVDEEVRVSGTVRRFDQDVIESVYDIDLEDDVFDAYEDSLVIVADSVSPADAPATATATDGPSASASPTDGTS